jgi:membrane protein DedA with SNARE-associated domain
VNDDAGNMTLNLPELIQTYGYAATFLGALFEGETVLTLAGVAVHRGHLEWPLVWLLATAGGSLGDVIYFALGRKYGTALLSRWPSFTPAIARAHDLVLRRPALSVIVVRFLYGVRIAGPMVIGASPLAWPRFLLLNVCGALLWSACWVGLGYLVGATAERMVGNLAKVERELFVAVLIGALAVVAFLKLRARAPRTPR